MCAKCHEKTGLLPIQKQLCKSAVYTAQLISTFVFDKLIVQPCFSNLVFQVLRLYRQVCVKPGWKCRSSVSSCHGSYGSSARVKYNIENVAVLVEMKPVHDVLINEPPRGKTNNLDF